MAKCAHTGSDRTVDHFAAELCVIVTTETELRNIRRKPQSILCTLLVSIRMTDGTAHLNSGMNNFTF
ncbi:MAG: hypothetical protein ABR903_05420 [Thermodesulfovibrionales bacterium]